MNKALADHDAVVTCLPYHLNLGVAQAAHRVGKHYFDLTEDVATTQAIVKLSKSAKGVMAPQCGLAPGFIGVVGGDLAQRFHKIRSIELRVGALPQNPRGLLGYAFNWSPEGVVNEYLNDCEVIKQSKRKQVPAMGSIETIVINGVQLESFSTSGGLGTLCETLDGRVETLNYKTIRYPGHCTLMRFFFDELYMRKDREKAGEILVNAKPPVNDDVVYVHAAVEGWQNKKLCREEFVRSYFPIEIGGRAWRAISWTTAASLCATDIQRSYSRLIVSSMVTAVLSPGSPRVIRSSRMASPMARTASIGLSIDVCRSPSIPLPRALRALVAFHVSGDPLCPLFRA